MLDPRDPWVMSELPSLASAAVMPGSDSNVELVLISSGIVVGAGLLAMLPAQLGRGHRHREAIVAMVILWGLLAAGSGSYSVMQQMDWSSTYTQRLETGYYDPADTSDKPSLPIVMWCGLGVGYVCLVIWAGMGRTNAGGGRGER
jgi:hypothetical protein